jgi:serine protease Do
MRLPSRRLLPLILFLASSTLAACGVPNSRAAETPLVASTDEAAVKDQEMRKALPPLNLAEPLPAAPLPATFDVANLAAGVSPTVVNITTRQRVNLPEGHPFEFFFGPPGAPRGERTGAGTGFVIDSAGYVVTNEHVVHDADEVLVRLADEREFSAKVVGRDPKLDLALLKLDAAKDLPAARLGTSESLRIGEHVLAVGNPFGLGHTVTLGIVSAKSRTIGAGPYDDFIQTDASINPGNSGGPLFNWRGEVVGINTAIRPDANNIGFAIPIDALRDVLPQLRDKGRVVRGKLGLVFQPISAELAKALKLDDGKGALVAQIEAGGAAARAGIKPGDVITSVNGTAIVHGDELPRRVAKNAPGSEIRVGLVRAGKAVEVKATLDVLDDEEAPPPPPKGPQKPESSQLGIQVSNLKSGEGVRVDSIGRGSPVKELAPGDIILEVDGKSVKNADELEKVLAGSKPGSVLLAKIRRGEASRFAAVPIPKPAS